MRGHNWSEGVNEALGVELGEGLKRPWVGGEAWWKMRGEVGIWGERTCGSCYQERAFGK